MPNYQKVANVGDVKPGSGVIVEVNGEEIALFNLDGNFYAISNNCPHRGGPLGNGTLEGEEVVCPWHGWRFNVRDGISPVAKTVSVKSYTVKIENDAILVDI